MSTSINISGPYSAFSSRIEITRPHVLACIPSRVNSQSGYRVWRLRRHVCFKKPSGLSGAHVRHVYFLSFRRAWAIYFLDSAPDSCVFTQSKYLISMVSASRQALSFFELSWAFVFEVCSEVAGCRNNRAARRQALAGWQNSNMLSTS